MRILLLSKYSRLGASSRLRTLQFLPFLQANGVEVAVNNLFDDNYLQSLYGQGERSLYSIFRAYVRRAITLLGVFRYDLIWIEYEIFPYLPAIAERLLRLMGKPYVVDYDDAVFHHYDLSPNLLLHRFLGRKIDVVMQNAACVIAGNAYLAERAMASGARHVEVLPTVVDHTRYTSRREDSGQVLVIGWIGSPSTQCLVLDVREALTKVCNNNRTRLLFIGTTQEIAEEFPGVDVEILPWSEENEVELIRRMDIGIMPLFDRPFQRGKCGYKLIQYMACSVPVIASPVGANVGIVSGSHCGLLASSQAEWEAALLQLLHSSEQRRAMGAAGRKAVEETYSLQVQAPVLHRIINLVSQSSKI